MSKKKRSTWNFITIIIKRAEIISPFATDLLKLNMLVFYSGLTSVKHPEEVGKTLLLCG